MVKFMAKKRVRSKQSIPENESKADRFIRVVKPRINKAVKAINTIGFCAGAAYEYTPQQVTQIMDALHFAQKELGDSFEKKASKTAVFDFTE